jgi:hypothetical protein
MQIIVFFIEFVDITCVCYNRVTENVVTNSSTAYQHSLRPLLLCPLYISVEMFGNNCVLYLRTSSPSFIVLLRVQLVFVIDSNTNCPALRINMVLTHGKSYHILQYPCWDNCDTSLKLCFRCHDCHFCYTHH